MHPLRWIGWGTAGSLLLMATLAAADCRTIRRQGYRDRVVIEVVEPAYYYSVGAALQEEAIADRVLKLLAERLERANVREERMESATSRAEPERLAGPGEPGPAGALATCTQCHREGGQGAAVWRPSTDCREQLRAIHAVITGKMPPAKIPFTDQQAAEAIETLSSE